jgi:hypothetical protein
MVVNSSKLLLLDHSWRWVVVQLQPVLQPVLALPPIEHD